MRIAHGVGAEPRPGTGAAAASENRVRVGWEVPEVASGCVRVAPDPCPLTFPLADTMGNVLAASSPPAGPPPPPTPSLVGLPPPPSPPGFTLPPLGGGLGSGSSAGRGSERTTGAAASGAAAASDDGSCGCLPNPGTFEECHRKCKGEGCPSRIAPGKGKGPPEDWSASLQSLNRTLGAEDGMGRWDLELGARNCDQMLNFLGKNATAGERSLRSLRARGPTPPRLSNVIRKRIIAQGHGVKRCSPRGFNPRILA